MVCDERQELLGAVLDGEAPAADQADLFAHLAGCAGCRAFIDTLVTLRAAAARDRDEAGAAAAAIPLPSLPGTAGHRGADRPSRRRAPGWHVPMPLAAALAVALLTGGALLGARWSRIDAGAGGLTAQLGRAPVVVICRLPEVVVH